jgi:cell division transport system permease protein
VRLTSILFVIREVLQGLSRHRLMALAATTTSAVCFAIFGAFLLVLLSLQGLGDNLLGQLGAAAYMKENTTRAQSEKVRDQISILPGVASVELKPKEAVWEDMKKKVSAASLDGIVGNPMTDELRINLVDVERIEPVAAAIGKMEGVAEVAVSSTEVANVQATVRMLRLLGTGAALLLLLASLGVIANVIRLTVFARRREIRIMQLVGATNNFIRAPFLLEGVIYGAAGAAAGTAMVVYGGQHVMEFTRQNLSFLNLTAPDLSSLAFYSSMTATGAFLGLLGSAVSIRKFLDA